LEKWIKIPNSFLSKQDRLSITVYGPYGRSLNKIRKICHYLSTCHGFSNSLPVIDRGGFRRQRRGEKDQVYEMRKSYYFLEVSDVNIFVYYCNEYFQSVDFELKHLLDNLSYKIPSSIVFRDSSCNMGRLFEGEIILAKIKSQNFNGRSKNAQREISDVANGYCMNILKRDFYLI
jgi:hypothetical protein